jgi:hypothetical protein
MGEFAVPRDLSRQVDQFLAERRAEEERRQRLLPPPSGQLMVKPIQPPALPPLRHRFPIPAFCSARYKSFLIMGERDGDSVNFIGTSLSEGDPNTPASIEVIGRLRFGDLSGYPGCPHCGTHRNREGVDIWWSTDCNCRGLFHCAGGLVCRCGTLHSGQWREQASSNIFGFLSHRATTGRR